METYHGNALTASDLDHDTEFKLIGDIEGTATFGYDKTKLEMTTDASGIVSSTATSGKALKLDNDLVLQATSADTKKLDHEVEIELTEAVTGSVTTDFSGNKITIETTIADTNVLTKNDIGTILADLDNNGKIKDVYLPDQSKGGFKVVGLWSSNTDAPSTNPTENTAWLVTGDCIFSSMNFKSGDWIYYYNSSWNRADISDSIHKINGYTGNSITLDYSDVNAISDDYIDYTVGATIPKDKIPITDKAGHLAGVTVDKLSKEFNLKTSATGHVIINATDSTNTKTDGSKDLDVSLEITEDGYTAIANKTQRNIKVNNIAKTFKKNLNFSGDITATETANELKLEFKGGKCAIYYNGTTSENFLADFGMLYEAREESPFILTYTSSIDNKIHCILFDNSLTGTNVTVKAENWIWKVENDIIYVVEPKCTLTTDSDGAVTSFSILETQSTYNTRNSFYGTCTTAASTTAKTSSITGYRLTKGDIVTIKFTYAVPANSTLNITSKGAKNIRWKSSNIVSDVIKAGDIATFIYDGTYYELLSISRNCMATTTQSTSKTCNLVSIT